MKGFLFFSETKAVGGVEPPLRALQAPVLPLDHTTIFKEGRIAGIEPALSIPQTDALTTELYPPQETSSIHPVNPLYEDRPATALWERTHRLPSPYTKKSCGFLPFESQDFQRLEYSQVVRHRFLVPTCEGSIPSTPVSFQKGYFKYLLFDLCPLFVNF